MNLSDMDVVPIIDANGYPRLYLRCTRCHWDEEQDAAGPTLTTLIRNANRHRLHEPTRTGPAPIGTGPAFTTR